MKDSIVKNILVNTRAFFTVNVRRRLNEVSTKEAKLEEIVEASSDQLLAVKSYYAYLHLMDYYARHEMEAQQYKKELGYLRELGKFCNFPYELQSEQIIVESGFDEVARLPYVIHRNKKLYFKADYAVQEAEETYKNYLLVERLLGIEDQENTPHQYQSPRVHVDEGDVVFDIGAAEGLFALDQVEKASHVVIVESDREWMEPLKHTFSPYEDKVSFVQNCVSVADTENTVSLEKLMSIVDYSSAFVKMDIEGAELPSIAAAGPFLKQKKGVKLAIASYHKQHDAEEMESFFKKIGYTSEFSNGFMLFHLFDTPISPYFRKGIIRAVNQNN